MFTPMELSTALSNFLEANIAKEIQLKCFDKKNNDFILKNPKVIQGFAINEFVTTNTENNYDSDFPCIIVRMLRLNNRNMQQVNHVVTVQIRFATYCAGSYKNEMLIEDGSGYTDIWNMIEKTRQVLFKSKIIDKKYRLLEMPFEAEVPEEQPYPYWYGYINALFDIGTPFAEF